VIAEMLRQRDKIVEEASFSLSSSQLEASLVGLLQYCASLPEVYSEMVTKNVSTFLQCAAKVGNSQKRRNITQLLAELLDPRALDTLTADTLSRLPSQEDV